MSDSKGKKVNDNHTMGLVDHLRELRNRLIVIFVFFFIVVGISFNFADEIVSIIVRTAQDMGYELIYISPAELLTQYFRLSMLIGLVLSSPIILYEVWAFIKPGLNKGEGVVVFCSLWAGMLCFIIGSLFAYFITLPFMLKFFITLDQYETVKATITIQNYMSFILSSLITFGLIFEMPALTVLLSQLGILKSEWLVKSRKIVVVVVFILGAIITPSDVVSQILVSIPMMFLFEFSVVLCKIINKTKARKTRELEID